MTETPPERQDPACPSSETESFAVGGRLLAVRRAMGLSQRELARRAQMTNSSLSMIEQGKVSPSIHSLERILRAIPMSLTEFFAGAVSQPPVIWRSEDLLRVRKDRVDYRVLPLAERIGSPAYLAEQYLPAGSVTTGDWMTRTDWLAGFVVRGQLLLTLDGETFILEPGDAYQFSRSRPHSFSNDGSQPCVLMAFVASASTPPSPRVFFTAEEPAG